MCNYFLFLKRRKYCEFVFQKLIHNQHGMEAMTKCRQQCATIENDATILKQHYLKVNEQFWLPAAVYKPRGQNSKVYVYKR